MARLSSGFTSIRELTSYLLGAGVLIYGAIEAPADRQLIVVGAGLALLGAPIVGGIFERKELPPAPPAAPPPGGGQP